MKKVYSNRFVIYFSIFCIAFLSIVTFVCVFSLINGIINNQSNMIMVYSILIAGFICFLSLFFLFLNRFGYKITYNEDERTIQRKGFICGYKYIVKIEDIKNIVTATFPKETTYYVIIDSHNTKYDGGSKKSFIRIEKNEDNLKFIKQFWDKPIENK